METQCVVEPATLQFFFFRLYVSVAILNCFVRFLWVANISLKCAKCVKLAEFVFWVTQTTLKKQLEDQYQGPICCQYCSWARLPGFQSLSEFRVNACRSFARDVFKLKLTFTERESFLQLVFVTEKCTTQQRVNCNVRQVM